MSEFTMDRLRENLEALKMKNTLEILDNYLERAVADNLNIVSGLRPGPGSSTAPVLHLLHQLPPTH